MKYTGAKAGDRHSDHDGLYLLVNPVGRDWRMNYRFLCKQKMLALGVYPAVALADLPAVQRGIRLLPALARFDSAPRNAISSGSHNLTVLLRAGARMRKAA